MDTEEESQYPTEESVETNLDRQDAGEVRAQLHTSETDSRYARPVFHPGGEERDHYHQYEDEVCLKCDNAELLRPDTSSRQMRNVQTEGCDYEFSKTDHRARLPQPPLTQISYPGYPRVSVQEMARPGQYDDTIPYYPPPRPFPQRFSLPRRHLPPPPRFAGGYRHFRPAQPLRVAGAGGEGLVTMRYPDYVPVRRPLSEVSPRQWGQIRGMDQTSLPRRRLPEIPHQRRLPDTLPRAGRMRDQFEEEPQTSHQAELRRSQQPEDHKTRNTQDKSKKQEKRTPRQPKGSSRSPNRQGLYIILWFQHPANFLFLAKAASLTESRGEERPRSRPGHSRTRSDVTANKGARSKQRHRVRRQSPVEERLSVHESDSMSDAFDDDGLFQIDENFAKFLDDKTSCQK